MGGLEVAEPTAGDDAIDREEPQAKKPRPAQRRIEVAASLDGIEARLQALGEAPRFLAVQPGQLQHNCTSADARVNFWPSTLRWSVEGRQCSSVEAARLFW